MEQILGTLVLDMFWPTKKKSNGRSNYSNSWQDWTQGGTRFQQDKKYNACDQIHLVGKIRIKFMYSNNHRLMKHVGKPYISSTEIAEEDRQPREHPTICGQREWTLVQCNVIPHKINFKAATNNQACVLFSNEIARLMYVCRIIDLMSWSNSHFDDLRKYFATHKTRRVKWPCTFTESSVNIVFIREIINKQKVVRII